MSGRNISQETLRQSMERRLKHVMVQVLNQFDNKFPASDDGDLYKFNVKNMFNDAMRASDRELMDYDVEYRPLRLNPDNTISITKTLLESLEKITFPSDTSMRITASMNKLKVLESVRHEFGAGIIYRLSDEQIAFEINGLDNCINLVIPFMDKFKLLAGVQDKYLQWRDRVVSQYIGREA